MRFAAVTLDEDILRLYDALLRWNGLDLFTLFAEPGHREILRDQCCRVWYRDEAEVSTDGKPGVVKTAIRN
jgi:hypothetical protein